MTTETRLVKDGALSMRISDRDGTTTVAAEGAIDLTNAWSLGQQLRAAIGKPSGRVVVDIGRVDFIDSTGLKELVAVQQLASKGSDALRFVRPRGDVARTLELTGIDKVLRFAD